MPAHRFLVPHASLFFLVIFGLSLVPQTAFASNVSLLGDYRFKKWGSVYADYRVLDYDYSSGSGASRFVFDTRLQGPLLGLAFYF